MEPAEATDEAHPPRTLGLLSVVAPMLDEAGVVEEFHRRVCSALEGVPFELVIIDDGSTDGTENVLDRLADEEPRTRVVHLSRNFGHQTALTAGLDHARGDVVVTIDSDLQDPPEVILEMLDRWRQGADVVYAVRRARAGETRFKLVTARYFYRLMDRLSQVRLEPDSGDFRLLDRTALDGLNSMRERNRYLRGMTVWIGFNQASVLYDRDARHGGETKYTVRKMVRFSLDALSSFSHAPLQVATWLGFVFALIAFMAIPAVVVARYLNIYERGVPSIFVAILLLGGIQLMSLGIIGEYIGRIYDEVKRRPLYLVRSRRNLDEPETGPVGEAEQERITSW